MKVYFDSSLYGGYFETEFQLDSRELFRRAKVGWYTVVWSEVVEREISLAPLQVRNLFELYTRSAASEKILITPKVVELANEYLARRIVPERMFNDALHVALATVYEITYLASWDERHLVDPARILGFQTANVSFGFKPVNIVTPRQLI